MKRNIIILLLAIAFAGCLPEGDAGCPEYLTVSFDLDDPHVAGDFDSRIANDVVLYVFREGKRIERVVVPYDRIRNGQGYTFRKTFRMHGQIDLVAWTVSESDGDTSSIPDWVEGDELGQLHLELSARTGPSDSRPAPCELYMGMVSFTEAVDVSSTREIEVSHAACRVEVNVSTDGAVVSGAPRVTVHGSMNMMDMGRKGAGFEAVVHAPLTTVGGGNGNDYTTGRFGILPSTDYQSVAVAIYDGDTQLATLSVPRDNLPRGARSGDLMIFDYQMGSNEFTLTVNGFRQVIVIVDGM